MIPGDIDLTEELDFMHDKPDPEDLQLPAIPWALEKIISKAKFKFNINQQPEINISITPTYNNTYITSATSDNNMWYYNNDWTAISNNNYITTYNYNYNSDYTFTLNNNNSSSYIISYSANTDTDEPSDTEVIFGIQGIEEKKNTYNSTIEYCYHCNSKHFKGRKCSCNNIIEEDYILPWDNKDKKVISLEDDLGDTSITWYPNTGFGSALVSRVSKVYLPWYDNDSYSIYKDNYYNNRITPWFEKMNHRIYMDYLQDLIEENDYSSYLTNMGWLGLS